MVVGKEVASEGVDVVGEAAQEFVTEQVLVKADEEAETTRAMIDYRTKWLYFYILFLLFVWTIHIL